MRSTCILSILLFFLSFILSFEAFGGTLFKDDFEKEEIGKMPSQWEFFGGAEGQGTKVVEDPIRKGNKVLFVNSPVWVGNLPEGAWVPKDKSFVKWTDYILEAEYMVDDASKLFAFNYRADTYANLLHYNVRRWNTSLVGLYKRENDNWTGAVKEVQYPQDANVWYVAQAIIQGNHHTLKLKKVSDQTDFSKIPPLIDVDVTGTKLDHGTINVMCYGFSDNIIVYVGTKSANVDPNGKLTTSWGIIKSR